MGVFMAQLLDGLRIVSAQDLISEYECQHKVALDAAVTLGNLSVEKVDNPTFKLLQDFGIAFEEQRLEALEATNNVKRLQMPKRSVADFQNTWVEGVRSGCHGGKSREGL